MFELILCVTAHKSSPYLRYTLPPTQEHLTTTSISMPSILSNNIIPKIETPIPPIAKEYQNRNTKRKYLNDKYKLRSWLLTTSNNLCERREPVRSQHLITFEDSDEAVTRNTDLLHKYDFDLTKTIAAQPNTVLSAGSEFRNILHLKTLLQYHQDWPLIKDIITNGITYPFHPDIDDSIRLDDLQHMIDRGNHKLALSIENSPILKKTYQNEIDQGWMFPVTLDCLPKIPHVMMTPVGIADQYTIDEEGNIKPKKRLTHDCSFPSNSGNSLNLSHCEDDLPTCIYGTCFRRILHQIHNL